MRVHSDSRELPDLLLGKAAGMLRCTGAGSRQKLLLVSSHRQQQTFRPRESARRSPPTGPSHTQQTRCHCWSPAPPTLRPHCWARSLTPRCLSLMLPLTLPIKSRHESP